MARIEFVCIGSSSGNTPVASAVFDAGSADGSIRRVLLVEVEQGISSTDAIPARPEGIIAVSDLDLGCVRAGTLLRAGDALLKIVRPDTTLDMTEADLVETGEAGSGDGISFERSGSANAGVLTLSDTCHAGGREDLSGPALLEALGEAGIQAVRYAVEPDERARISHRLRSWCDDGSCDLILTTGGTGFSPRDCAPEATLDVLERMVPGIPEMIRLKSSETVPTAWLSRSVAGIRGAALIVNLPGSRKGALECFGYLRPLLGHALEVTAGRVSRCGG